MSTKKRVSYQKLLKEAISEYDTTKTVDVKGPMLDPILSYAGGGELPTHKDAASILERYYFKEEEDGGVEINDKGEDGKGMEHAEGTGTEQAGTDDKGIAGAKKDAEKEIAKESKRAKGGKVVREEEEAKEEEKKEEEEEEKPVTESKKAKRIREEEEKKEEEKKEDDEKKDEEVAMENAIIEKLIAEMEEEDKKDDEPDGDADDKEAVAEGDAPDYEGTGVKPGMEAPDEKEAKTSMDDAQGAGTQQAGTGDANGQVPDRKDVADSFTKPPTNLEQEDKSEGDEEKEEELDVDKKVEESAMVPSMQKKGRQEDQGADELHEIFRLFKEEIEAEADEEEKSDDADEEKKD